VSGPDDDGRLAELLCDTNCHTWLAATRVVQLHDGYHQQRHPVQRGTYLTISGLLLLGGGSAVTFVLLTAGSCTVAATLACRTTLAVLVPRWAPPSWDPAVQ
jgi:hypothetical protein